MVWGSLYVRHLSFKNAVTSDPFSVEIFSEFTFPFSP